jgi:hypothetical protein
MDNKPDSQSISGGNITIGDMNNVQDVVIGNGNVVTHTTQGVSGEEIVKIFETLSQKVKELPDGPNKMMADTAVTGLEQEVKKGDAAQEQTLTTWFNFLAQAAPDIFDVAVAALANPAAGVAKVVQLVAKKAQEAKK